MSSILGKYGVKLKFKYETQQAKSESYHPVEEDWALLHRLSTPTSLCFLLLKPFFIVIVCIRKKAWNTPWLCCQLTPMLNVRLIIHL